MSITTSELIDNALREINVISQVGTATAEDGSFALRKLNQLMESWRIDGIDVGYYRQPDTSGTVPIPEWAEAAVTTSLGLSCAPNYGKSVSPEMAAIGQAEYTKVLREAQKIALDNADMTHMPIGQGHYGTGYDITTDS